MSKHTAPKVLKAAIYTRKSTTLGLEQDFNSIDAQREACEAYAKQQGWSVVPARFDDGGFSGANTDRPAFQRLLQGIERRQFDIIVCHRLDRLSRSLSDFVGLMTTLTQHNVGFCCVTQNFDTSTPAGKLMLHMLLSFAEFERSMIVERTRDKMAASRRRGQWTGGTIPLGYQVLNKKLVLVPQEAVTVRRCFELFLANPFPTAVARQLNEEGHITKTRLSRRGNFRQGGKFRPCDVRKLLQNPLVAGMTKCGQEFFKGEHDPIISPDTFRSVQTLLDGPKLQPTRNPTNPAYILKGILTCKHCGHPMMATSTNPRGKQHRYYRCDSRQKRGLDCGRSNVPAVTLEQFVVGRVREACSGLDLAREVTERAKVRLAERRESLKAELRELPEKIAGLNAEARTMMEPMSSASKRSVMTFAQKLMAERVEEIGLEVAALERRRALAESELVRLEGIEIQQEWVSGVVRDFDAMWEVLSHANQRRLLQALVKSVVVDANNGRVEVELVEIGAGDEPASSAVAPAAKASPVASGSRKTKGAAA